MIFDKKVSDDSAYTMRLRTFVKITLSHILSGRNEVLVLPRNSRWPPKMAQNHFWQKAPDDCLYPAGQKHCPNRSILHHFPGK